MIKRVREGLKGIEIMMVKLKYSLAAVKQQKTFSKEFIKDGNKKIMRSTIFRKGSENRYQQLRIIHFFSGGILKIWEKKSNYGWKNSIVNHRRTRTKITHRFQNLFSGCHVRSTEKNCYIPLPLPQMLCSLTQDKAG